MASKKDGEEKQVTAPAPLPVDWTRMNDGPTNVIRLPGDVTEINKEDDSLVIVGTSGQKITKMGADLWQQCNPNLQQLILRSHLIRTMEGLDGFRSLDLLELYDNMIEYLENLGDGEDGCPGKTLRVLDMSYNVIRDMKPVSLCPNLKELYLANNKLKTMAGLSGLSQLRKIDLGANRIRVMDEKELSGMVNLEELWLGKNKIEKIEGLEKLTRLRRLDVQSNRLTAVENLTTQLDTLEELYLAHNGITNEGASQPTGLALQFTELNTLDLSRNFLTSTQPFAHLITLDELWLSGNKVATFQDVQPLSALGTSPGHLEGLYLEYNPVADEFEYRKKLKEILPSLKQIDANLVGGLAAHGIQPVHAAVGPAETTEAQLRRLQDIAVAKAKAETEAKEQEHKKDGRSA